MATYKSIKITVNMDNPAEVAVYDFLKSKKNCSDYIRKMIWEQIKTTNFLDEDSIKQLELLYDERIIPEGKVATPKSLKNSYDKIEKIDSFKILSHQDGRCKHCNKLITIHDPSLDSNMHVDHIYPISKGGLTAGFNMQILCQTCNLSKGNSLDKVDKEHIDFCERNNLLTNRLFYKKQYTKEEVNKIKENVILFLKHHGKDFKSIYSNK